MGKGVDGNMGGNERLSLAVEWTDELVHQHAALSDRDLDAIDRMLGPSWA